MLVFGQINALTLVLGASLVGVAADYPQHYLSKSWSNAEGRESWSSWGALRATLPGLSLSLGTNLIGYLALAFTPFPALTQVALFSRRRADCRLSLFGMPAASLAAWPAA